MKRIAILLTVLLLAIFTPLAYGWIFVTTWDITSWTSITSQSGGSPVGTPNVDTYTLSYWTDADMGRDKDATEALTQLLTFDVPVAQNAYMEVKTATGQFDTGEVFKSTEDFIEFKYGFAGGALTTYQWTSITPQWYGLRLTFVDTVGATTDDDNLVFNINRQTNVLEVSRFGAR